METIKLRLGALPLGVKIFISYLVVIFVGGIVMLTTAEFVAPRAFERHLAAMSAAMDTPVREDGDDSTAQLDEDLFVNFRAAVNEAITLAAVAATAIAILVSLFVSRQVVAPVQDMMRASRRIAEGHYDERVRVVGDISLEKMDELSQLALSFNRMAATLEHTENMRQQLIGDVTHELRTPLTTIKGYMEGLIDEVLPAEQDTYQAIYHQADRLSRLVADLQELSRVEADAYKLDIRAHDADIILQEAASCLERQFQDKGVTLHLETAENLPPVLADRDRIGQALINLLGNALQYTPSGGHVTMTASLWKHHQIKITVIDTGIGIPSEHLPHIFTRFYRVDKSRSRAGGGSGIGLTITKRLVERHGGRIWADSPGPGQGSVFAFTLPAARL